MGRDYFTCKNCNSTWCDADKNFSENCTYCACCLITICNSCLENDYGNGVWHKRYNDEEADEYGTYIESCQWCTKDPNHRIFTNKERFKFMLKHFNITKDEIDVLMRNKPVK